MKGNFNIQKDIQCECFEKTKIFASLNNDELKYLDGYRCVVSFKKGEIIFKQGMPATHVIVLREGLVKAYLEGSYNKNLIVGIIEPWNVIADPGIYKDSLNHYTLATITDCTACFFEVKAIKKMISRNCKFAKEFIEGICDRLILSFNMMLTLSQKNVEGKMAEAILYLHNIFKNQPIDNFSKQDIADITAMSKESAHRVLKDFINIGIMEEKNDSLIVLDKEKIENIALHG
jgi:CRP/FNR family transcriptional regulator